MKQAFVFGKVAVLVFPWHEPMEPPERGTRVEVRLLQHEAPQGTPSAAERIVIDAPLFRADLFDQMNAPPGNLRAAHFHPRFEGVEPCDRVWDRAIQQDPTGWLAGQLGDLVALLKASGADAAAPWVEDDAAALRARVPAIVAAVEATWADVRRD
jgi:hypothetical protein